MKGLIVLLLGHFAGLSLTTVMDATQKAKHWRARSKTRGHARRFATKWRAARPDSNQIAHRPASRIMPPKTADTHEQVSTSKQLPKTRIGKEAANEGD